MYKDAFEAQGPAVVDDKIDVGDTVKLMDIGSVGEVLSSPNAKGDIQVRVGGLSLKTNIDRVKKESSESKTDVKGGSPGYGAGGAFGKKRGTNTIGKKKGGGGKKLLSQVWACPIYIFHFHAGKGLGFRVEGGKIFHFHAGKIGACDMDHQTMPDRCRVVSENPLSKVILLKAAPNPKSRTSYPLLTLVYQAVRTPGNTLDLRGVRAEDVGQKIDMYLDGLVRGGAPYAFILSGDALYLDIIS